jgi:hypothetical protein
MTLTDISYFVRNQINAPRIIREQTALLVRATEIIVQQQQDIEELEGDIRSVKLEHMRQMQGMAAAWLINMERPEVDLREQIAKIERTFAESIAVIEEHIVR